MLSSTSTRTTYTERSNTYKESFYIPTSVVPKAHVRSYILVGNYYQWRNQILWNYLLHGIHCERKTEHGPCIPGTPPHQLTTAWQHWLIILPVNSICILSWKPCCQCTEEQGRLCLGIQSDRKDGEQTSSTVASRKVPPGSGLTLKRRQRIGGENTYFEPRTTSTCVTNGQLERVQKQRWQE